MEEKHNVKEHSPRQCFRQAYQLGLLEYDPTWIKMADVRNETAHTYRENIAEEVYEQLPQFLLRFQLLKDRLTQEGRTS